MIHKQAGLTKIQRQKRRAYKKTAAYKERLKKRERIRCRKAMRGVYEQKNHKTPEEKAEREQRKLERYGKRVAKAYQKYAHKDETLEEYIDRYEGELWAARLKAPPEGTSRWFLTPPTFLDTTGGQGLSRAANLPEYVIFHRVRNPKGIIPEWDLRNRRRCVVCSWQGNRCINYCPKGTVICGMHNSPALIRQTQLPSAQYTVKNGRLKEVFERHLADPNAKSMQGELALARTMLTLMLDEIDACKQIGDISMPQIAGILSTVKLVSEMIEKISSIETKMASKLSIEQLNTILTSAFESIVRICAPTQDQCQKLANEIGGIQALRDAAVLSTYGDDVQTGLQGTRKDTVYSRDGVLAGVVTLTQEEYDGLRLSECQTIPTVSIIN